MEEKNYWLQKRVDDGSQVQSVQDYWRGMYWPKSRSSSVTDNFFCVCNFLFGIQNFFNFCYVNYNLSVEVSN